MRMLATLTLILTPFLACAAPDRGQSDMPVEKDPGPVRAMGNEPFWHVDLSEDDGLVYSRLGEESITFPYAAPEMTGEAPVAYAYGPIADATGAHTIQLIIVDEPCQDTMADLVHPMTSIVTLDGEELRGCARPLEVAAGGFSVE